MDVFVSYARADVAAVRGLTDDIALGDHRVWFDRDLHGGDDWWRRILERVRECSVVVFALSEHSLRSQVCRAELDYAEALGVPVVPIQVGAVESVATSRVARYHVIDGREQGSAVGYRVMAALAAGTARRTPLPDPMPPEPEVPFAYLAALARRIDAPELRPIEQAAIIGQLRHALRDETDDGARGDARRLLAALRGHPECTWGNAQEIDTILDGFAAAAPRRPAPVYDRPASTIDGPIALPSADYLAVSPDGRQVYVANNRSGSVSVVDVGSGAVVGSPIAVGKGSLGVAVSPDGRRLYVANSGDKTLSVIDTGLR